MKRLSVLVMLLGLPWLSVASEWTPQLELLARYTDGPSQTGAMELEMFPAVEWAGASNRFRGSTRFRWMSYPRYDAFDPSDETYERASRPRELGTKGSAELRDFFYEYRFSNAQLRVGKQPIDWGMLDGFKLLDVVNPQDFRAFILDDFSRSRIPTWSVRAQGTADVIDWDVFWSPDNSVHDVPDRNTHFDFTAAGYQLPRGIATVRPQRNSWGIRLGMRQGEWALRGSVVQNHEHVPTVGIQAGETVLFYPDRRLYGVQLEGNIGALVLRSELTYQPDEEFRRTSLGGVDQRDNYSAALASDFQALGWYVSVQWVHEAYAPNTRHLDLFTLFARKTFWNDRVQVMARWYGSDQHDALFRLGLHLELPRALGTLELGGDVFRGSRETLFGQFAARDQYYLGWRKVF